MPLRIGFDMDGVVADLNAALLREARALFPELDLQAPGRAHPELAPVVGPCGGASNPSVVPVETVKATWSLPTLSGVSWLRALNRVDA